jgi:hypothetical protein
MQPGTGSWDRVFWSLGARRFPVASGLEIFAGVSARCNGNNSRDYRFGRELTTSLGARLNTGKFLDYGLHARYRWADYDQRFDADVPNTGGDWFYLVPAVSARLGQAWGAKLEAEIPLYRHANGFRQFTSTFLASLSLFIEF